MNINLTYIKRQLIFKKKVIKKTIKGKIMKYNQDFSKYKNTKKIFMMQTPEHGNLGDHAIVYAQHAFVKKYLNEYKIIEIPFNEVLQNIKNIKKNINNDDLFFIVGGGNMGDMYIEEEYIRRHIINKFRKNKVISFPQTISFSNSTYGTLELKKSSKVYSKNKNLTIIGREKKSFDIMKETFGSDKVLLTPDIVLSLDKRNNKKRDGIVTCLRSDLEKSISDKDTKKIFGNLKVFGNIKKTDTILNKKVLAHQRDYELNKIWDTISGAEVVITDRLHGMIFCAITATPCIVLRNSNHKIEESYKAWLSDLDYIKLISNNHIDSILNIVEELKIKNLSDKKFIQFDDKFSLIKKEVTNL